MSIFVKSLLSLELLAVSSVVALGAQETAHDASERSCKLAHFPEHFADWQRAHPQYSGAAVPVPVDSLDVKPERTQSARLPYPKEAHEAGYEAYVVVEVVVEPSGRVDFAEVLESFFRHSDAPGVSGIDRDDFVNAPRVSIERWMQWQFLRTAIGMLKGSRYKPGQIAGRPVASVLCVPIAFHIRPW